MHLSSVTLPEAIISRILFYTDSQTLETVSHLSPEFLKVSRLVKLWQEQQQCLPLLQTSLKNYHEWWNFQSAQAQSACCKVNALQGFCKCSNVLLSSFTLQLKKALSTNNFSLARTAIEKATHKDKIGPYLFWALTCYLDSQYPKGEALLKDYYCLLNTAYSQCSPCFQGYQLLLNAMRHNLAPIAIEILNAMQQFQWLSSSKIPENFVYLVIYHKMHLFIPPLLQYGFSISPPGSITKFCPLICAWEHKNRAAFLLLLRNGFDPNVYYEDKKTTLLLYLIEQLQEDTSFYLEALLNKGARFDQTAMQLLQSKILCAPGSDKLPHLTALFECIQLLIKYSRT